MIEVKNISKSFKTVKALENVTLNFEENKIYGLLGRNGAGKSTLLNILTDKIFPDSGNILIDGENADGSDKVLGKLFLMNEKNYYPENMKVKDAFKWEKNFFSMFDADEALRLAGIFKLNTKSRIKNLSTGYSSIFKAIVALCVNTPYVFLDEPVLGLDANHRELLYKVILEKYANRPSTIIISTHLIEEVSNVIEETVIIHKGKVLIKESCESLLSSGYTVTGTISKVEEYTEGKNVLSKDTLGGIRTAYIMGTPENVPGDLEISKPDLQKLFIHLTNDEEDIK